MKTTLAGDKKVTYGDVEVNFHHGKFNASFTFEFMKKASVRGEPLGTGITGDEAIFDLLTRTNREGNRALYFTNAAMA